MATSNATTRSQVESSSTTLRSSAWPIRCQRKSCNRDSSTSPTGSLPGCLRVLTTSPSLAISRPFRTRSCRENSFKYSRAQLPTSIVRSRTRHASRMWVVDLEPSIWLKRQLSNSRDCFPSTTCQLPGTLITVLSATLSNSSATSLRVRMA